MNRSDTPEPLVQAKRWNGFGTSIFTEMSDLARHFQAVNLAQGFPDYPGPQKLLDAVCDQLQNCHNQYSHSSGEEVLRQQVSNLVMESLNLYYDPRTEITITTGATEAIYVAINAFVNPGDKVLVFEPFYDSYAQAVANAGGILVPVRLHAPDTPVGMQAKGWGIDWDEFEAASAGGFSFLILNTPHNPTGKVFTLDELERISNRVIKNNALVLSDEVYEYMVYDSFEHQSPAVFPKLRNRVIRISSAAKTFGFTGFKVGWILAAPELTRTVRLVHQAVVFCTNAHVQLGLAHVMQDTSWLKTYLASLKTEYAAKQAQLKSTLERAGFTVQAAQGSYFLMANFEALAGDVSDVVYAKSLIETHSIAAIPPSVFYVKAPKSLPWLRFAFCKKEETLRRAAELLLQS